MADAINLAHQEAEQFACLLRVGPENPILSQLALRFYRQVLALKHQVLQVFLMGPAVLHAKHRTTDSSMLAWQTFIQEYQIPCFVCSRSASHYGLYDEDTESSIQLAPGFELAGLITWYEACTQANSILTWG